MAQLKRCLVRIGDQVCGLAAARRLDDGTPACSTHYWAKAPERRGNGRRRD